MKRTELKRKSPLKNKAPIKRAPMKRGKSMNSKPGIRSDPMKNAAAAEDCTLQIAGVCKNRVETTVLCHLPDESSGRGLKSDDISSCFGCFDCHALIDGASHLWPEGEYVYREWYLRRAQTRTLRRLIEMGIISIKGVR